MKTFKALGLETVGNLNPQGHLGVRASWETNVYNQPLVVEMEKAYELQVRRAQELMKYYSGGSAQARMAVESFVSRSYNFDAPPSQLTTEADRSAARAVARVMRKVNALSGNGIPKHRADEFLHTMASFPSLVLASVQREFLRLSQDDAQRSDCWSGIFEDKGTKRWCEDSVAFGIVPENAGDDDTCAIGDTGLTARVWKFGEVEIGEMHNFAYMDKVQWSWDLMACSQYGGWTDELIAQMNRIVDDRLRKTRLSMLVDSTGPLASVFNADNANIVTSTDGTFNPAVTCQPEALDILEHFGRVWSDKRDRFGNLLPMRTFRIVTNDWGTYQAFTRALNARITEHATVNNGTCIAEIEMEADAVLPNIDSVCYDHDLREIYSAEPIFFIAPIADGSGRNVGRYARIEGMEAPMLMQKAPTWQTLSGQALNSFGNTQCFDTEVAIMSAGAQGLLHSELIYASNGSGVA